MKIFIYKRTHKHDPDENGVFGNQDCMGRLRNGNYDAVIGIGGVSAWPGHTDIIGKVNWVGLEPKRIPDPDSRGDLIVFSHFMLYEEKGKDILKNYPNLYKYMYEDGNLRRYVKKSVFTKKVQDELDRIINSVKNCPPSKMYNNANKACKKNRKICISGNRKRGCAPEC